jgi:DNA repair photolyase
VGFEYSINAYRGCEHGCIYCYARPTHEWLGYSAGLDFETKIFVKETAPALLREALGRPGWRPQTIGMSGVTDCYQPIERKLQITRRCLEVLAECRNPVAVITKNHSVTRDIDLLGELARFQAVRVLISITTLRPELQRVMEPRTSVPRDRLKALEALSGAGIPTGVMVAPVIPGLTDHEMPAILQAAREAGAGMAAFTAVRLPYGVKDLFADWLGRHFPDRKEKVLNRIRSMREGKLNNSTFGSRMSGEGLFAEQLRDLFRLARRKAGYPQAVEPLSAGHFRRPMRGGQMRLFE